MRSVAVCKLTAPASSDAEAREQKLLGEVLPEVARQDGDGTVLACGLFRRDRNGELSVHLCRVLGDGDVDARLEAVGDALAATGAEPDYVRRLDEAGCVPDEETVDAQEQGSGPLLVCRVRLEHDRDREAFERLLIDDILRADVERGPTRTNTFESFRVLRDESPSAPADWRYVLEARGFFFAQNLFPGTLERLEAEGARVIECTEYAHVGSA
jgi:hypothetical protein